MRMKCFGLVILAMLMTSCGLRRSQTESAEQLNRSSLYDPPTITLIEGKEYQFEEGTLEGRGQKFHSHYSYMRALQVGE